MASELPILESSKAVDIVYKNAENNEVVLKIKQAFNNLLGSGKNLPAGTEIKVNADSNYFVEGSKLHCSGLDISSENNPINGEIIIDTGIREDAESAMNVLKKCAENYDSKLPILGSLIDSQQRNADLLAGIRKALSGM